MLPFRLPPMYLFELIPKMLMNLNNIMLQFNNKVTNDSLLMI